MQARTWPTRVGNQALYRVVQYLLHRKQSGLLGRFHGCTQGQASTHLRLYYNGMQIIDSLVYWKRGKRHNSRAVACPHEPDHGQWIRAFCRSEENTSELQSLMRIS